MDKYEFLIVGTGAGGATLARELARKGKHPLIIEAGIPEKNVGTYRDSARFYDVRGLGPLKTPKKSREGVVIWRTLMAGGSTMVSCGNGAACLEKELSDLGIDLEAELDEAGKELQVSPLAERLLSDGSLEIMKAGKGLGYNMEPMPKFIDPKMCRKCGKCVLGCSYNARWTALEYLKEAEAQGAEVMYGTRCLSAIIDNGQVKGIQTAGPQGNLKIMADNVIIAAGGLGTPVILQKSGISKAGSGLFVDLMVVTYGTTDGLNQVHEPAMTLVNYDFYRSRGFILSPFVNHPAPVKFLELGLKGFALKDKKVIGMMTKIRDEATGRVYPDGSVSKSVTKADREKLSEGSRLSTEILLRAGANNIIVSRAQGAHPGGTAAVGTVVDSHLQTEVNNLFVCDASVLPTSPGLPPILTIVALAKRLAKKLA